MGGEPRPASDNRRTMAASRVGIFPGKLQWTPIGGKATNKHLHAQSSRGVQIEAASVFAAWRGPNSARGRHELPLLGRQEQMFGGLKQNPNRKQSDQQASAPRSSSTTP